MYSLLQASGTSLYSETVLRPNRGLQEFLPMVIKILHKGLSDGAALRIIECYLLLGQLQALLEYMPAIQAALEKSVQSVLEYKETPQGPQFGKIRGMVAMGKHISHSRYLEVLTAHMTLDK